MRDQHNAEQRTNASATAVEALNYTVGHQMRAPRAWISSNLQPSQTTAAVRQLLAVLVLSSCAVYQRKLLSSQRRQGQQQPIRPAPGSAKYGT